MQSDIEKQQNYLRNHASVHELRQYFNHHALSSLLAREWDVRPSPINTLMLGTHGGHRLSNARTMYTAILHTRFHLTVNKIAELTEVMEDTVFKRLAVHRRMLKEGNSIHLGKKSLPPKAAAYMAIYWTVLSELTDVWKPELSSCFISNQGVLNGI